MYGAGGSIANMQGTVPELYDMMSSSSGNIFRVTGLLRGEFLSQRPVMQGFDVFFDLRPKRLGKQSRTGDLRRIHAHHDVTVMDTSTAPELYEMLSHLIYSKALYGSHRLHYVMFRPMSVKTIWIPI